MLLLSLVLGVLTYALLEVAAIQFVGGRCYSIPFGGVRCGSEDWPWISSILFWVGVWRACIYVYIKKRKPKLGSQ